ncbi:Putative glycosyl transferase [Paramixta manurensis]|uniref:Glycosyl transferase n=1 Tax=Paramixta manurensis TaxID=2740817 RepID=A0A6M8U4Q4_9GAMM|nr:Putative glycosyl transferase [Erwiniaceae bacterium PD-1]
MKAGQSVGNPLLARLMARTAASTRTTDAALPFVSVVTPTWQRRAFLPYLIYMFQYQDYPADRRELVILDDSPHSNQDLIDALTAAGHHSGQIRYYHVAQRMNLGQKRNRLNQLARGEYIICMDDDDYYPADKISYTIGEMQRNNALFAGCDRIPIWYSHINCIYTTGSFGDRHALNGTFAYHRRFLKKHRYDDDLNLAEEGSFLNGFTVPVLQLDPLRSILCISHHTNTFDKDFIMANCERLPQRLEELVTDLRLRQHYLRLHQAPGRSKIQWDFFPHIVINPLSRCEETQRQLCQTLRELGVAEQQLVLWTLPLEDEPLASSHLAIAQYAQAQGWTNYLILDDRISLVRQQKTVDALNRLLQALGGLKWDVALLGARLLRLFELKSLPGAVRAMEAELPVAYAVNQPYYATLIENLAQGLALQQLHPAEPRFALDNYWKPLMQSDLWLALYPGLAYRHSDEHGNDLTAEFFRKRKPD